MELKLNILITNDSTTYCILGLYCCWIIATNVIGVTYDCLKKNTLLQLVLFKLGCMYDVSKVLHRFRTDFTTCKNINICIHMQYLRKDVDNKKQNYIILARLEYIQENLVISCGSNL